MAITFFNINKPSKNKPLKKENETLIELEEVIIPGRSSYMTYIDIDGNEKLVNGGFNKNSDGSYVINKTEIDKYDIYTKIAYSYKNVDEHFSYLDNEGNERVFNKPETLRYDEDEMAYYGEVSNIEYIETEVELTEKDK